MPISTLTPVGRVFPAGIVAAVTLTVLAAFPSVSARAADAPPAGGPPANPAADAASAYQKLVAGATTQKGVVTVHETKGRFLLEVPTSLLGRDLLWYAELSEMPTGFVPAGVGVEFQSRLVRLERVRDALFVRDLTQPLGKRVVHRAEPGEHPSSDEKQTPMDVALRASSLPAALLALPVAATSPDGALVVDVSAVFGADVPDFSPIQILAAGGVKVVAPAPDRSYVRAVRAFPRNVEVSSFLTYRAADPSAVSVVVRHSLTLLPDVPMRPRYADPRVGFFTTAFDDYAGTDAAGRLPRELISRYRLEKKDPAAAVSEPVQPIVYYIGRGVPDRWRPYFKQAVEDWQVAFEAAGFAKAIVAKDAPTEAEDPAWDPSDTRYSVIRWLEQPVANAMGPHTSDPRTGEILSAHVLIWSEVLTIAETWYVSQIGGADAGLKPLPLPDELMGRLIRYIVGHEVGHSLGLRHNHRASQVFTVAQLRDKAFTDRYASTPSIMSYGRFNYVAQPGDGVTNVVPKIGPYDLFAIQWGYAPVPGAATPEAERPTLAAWADRQRTEPFLAFGGEDVASIVDPNVLTENLGSDRIEATRLGLANLERLMGRLVTLTASPTGDLGPLEAHYKSALDHRLRWLLPVVKLIGGVEEDRALAGSGAPRYARVSRARAQAAVAFVLGQLRTPTAFLPSDVLARLGPVAVVDPVSKQQAALLDALLADLRFALLSEQAIVAPAEAYPAVDYLRDVARGVFEELAAPSVKVDELRRRLQRRFLATLAKRIASDDDETDFKAAARAVLQQVGADVEDAEGRAGDGATKAHLAHVRATVATMLRPAGAPR